MDKQDIAPALLESIRTDFLRLLGDAAPSAATYPAALDYADLVGDALAEAFRLHLSADTLPDGRMYWNIANRVLRPLLEEDHALVADAAAAVQQQLNKAVGLGLLAQRVPVDEDRIDDILNKICAAERYEDVAYMLDEPVRTFSRMAVDDTLKVNVQFQGRVGLRPRVVRHTTGSCCEWCSRLAGSYDYPHVPTDVYRRHERCRCRVEYDPGDGRRQNVWDKKWTEGSSDRQERIKKLSTIDDNSAKIEARKALGMDLPTRQFASQELLQRHYSKHHDEFGDISIPTYLDLANAFADKEISEDIVQLIRSDGSTSKYCFSTNEFIVINADGTLRTYFKPKDKEAYWNVELERNK